MTSSSADPLRPTPLDMEGTPFLRLLRERAAEPTAPFPPEGAVTFLKGFPPPCQARPARFFRKASAAAAL